MWPGLVQLAKEGGVNAIETYVFWNGHELSPNNVSVSASFSYFSHSHSSSAELLTRSVLNCSTTLGEGMIW